MSTASLNLIFPISNNKANLQFNFTNVPCIARFKDACIQSYRFNNNTNIKTSLTVEFNDALKELELSNRLCDAFGFRWPTRNKYRSITNFQFDDSYSYYELYGVLSLIRLEVESVSQVAFIKEASKYIDDLVACYYLSTFFRLDGGEVLKINEWLPNGGHNMLAFKIGILDYIKKWKERIPKDSYLFDFNPFNLRVQFLFCGSEESYNDTIEASNKLDRYSGKHISTIKEVLNDIA